MYKLYHIPLLMLLIYSPKDFTIGFLSLINLVKHLFSSVYENSLIFHYRYTESFLSYTLLCIICHYLLEKRLLIGTPPRKNSIFNTTI